MVKNGKIKKTQRPFRLNIGFIIFLILFVYIAFTTYTYIHKDKVSFYEVTDGGMSIDKEHVGIAVREESTQVSDRSGYINYLVTGGKRVSVGNEIYALDETGNMTAFLASNEAEEISLSQNSIHKIQEKLKEFSQTYSDDNFSYVYDTKTSVNSALLEYSDLFGSDKLNELLTVNGITYSRFYSPSSGIVSFDIDGFETRSAESLTEDDFQTENYHFVHMRSGQLVEKNEPVYKLVTSEEWNIVFPLTEEEQKLFSGLTSLTVVFHKNGLRCTAPYIQVNSSDGNAYGKLTLDKYMVDFIDERYLSFDIEEDISTGLKIPKSAVVSKTFLTVPEEYLAHGGDSLNDGFYKEVYDASGTSVEFTEAEIFYQENGRYYLDFSSNAPLQPGDYLVRPGTADRFKLGETANLNGVYCINKGYAVFKQIEILDSNDEFYTLKKNQKYGLTVYDHILFDPEGVNEGDFIYQ